MKKSYVKITPDIFDQVKSLKQNGMNTRTIPGVVGISLSSVSRILTTRTYEEYRKPEKSHKSRTKITPEKFDVAKILLENHRSVSKIAKALGVTNGTIYYIKNSANYKTYRNTVNSLMQSVGKKRSVDTEPVVKPVEETQVNTDDVGYQFLARQIEKLITRVQNLEQEVRGGWLKRLF